jgi:hypothetical protein
MKAKWGSDERRRLAIYIKLLDKCDHTLPSGESAWRGEMFFSSCTLCGLSDL